MLQTKRPTGIGSRLDGVLPTGAGLRGAAIFRETDLRTGGKVLNKVLDPGPRTWLLEGHGAMRYAQQHR